MHALFFLSCNDGSNHDVRRFANAGVYEIMEQTKKELFRSTGVDVTISKARK